MSQKSYDGKNALYLIPTPIGNLGDLTLRSIETLKMVDTIFSEDTRVTSDLLRYLEIKKPLIASHKFNEEKNVEKLLSLLKEGKNIGLVTDRGTPIISDPGSLLVKEAVKNNFSVIALPGATAFVPALIVSGLSAEHFYFVGFLNSKQSTRRKELQALKSIKDTLVFYEAPHRINKTLEDILFVLGNRQISISREITKKFEEVYRGTVTAIAEEIKDAKGEMVIVLEGNLEEQNYEHLSLVEHVNLYIKEGKDKKDAMKAVAKDRSISKSEVYKAYQGDV